MPLVTLTELRTRVRQRSDNEHTGSAFVTDTEITQLLNTSYQELYGNLVRSGLHTSETTYSITATGAAAYDLPSDFYALIGVWYVDSGYRRRLGRHSVRHRVGTTQTGVACTYRFKGGDLELAPRPTGGTYELVYIPQPALLSAGSDVVDGVLGWEEYLVVDAAIKVLQKEESDVRVLLGERERLLARIQDEAAAAEQLESWTVDNVRGSSQDVDGYFNGDRRGYTGTRW